MNVLSEDTLPLLRGKLESLMDFKVPPDMCEGMVIRGLLAGVSGLIKRDADEHGGISAADLHEHILAALDAMDQVLRLLWKRTDVPQAVMESCCDTASDLLREFFTDAVNAALEAKDQVKH